MNTREFPNAPHDWSTNDTESAANELGITLTDAHWDVIAALQEYFEKNETINRRELTDALDEKFHSQGGLKYLYRLFPGGPVAQGCRLSGIELPAGSVDQSFGSVV